MNRAFLIAMSTDAPRRPRYVETTPYGVIRWTADADAAHQFPTRAAAKRFAAEHFDGAVRVTEA